MGLSLAVGFSVVGEGRGGAGIGEEYGCSVGDEEVAEDQDQSRCHGGGGVCSAHGASRALALGGWAVPSPVSGYSEVLRGYVMSFCRCVVDVPLGWMCLGG